MRDFINPTLFTVSLLLVVCAFAMGGDTQQGATLAFWSVIICGVLFLVDLTIGIARALTHRPAMGKIAWSFLFVLVGAVAMPLSKARPDTDNPAVQEFNTMLERYRATGDATLANEVGDTLLVVAAAIGNQKTVQEMLEKAPAPEMVARAMQRAADDGHMACVKLLLPEVDVNAVSEGTTALISAAAAGRAKVAEFLLENGADPNLKDESGTPPLNHAVISKSAPTVETLLKHGADPKATDADGRDAASFSDSERMDALLKH